MATNAKVFKVERKTALIDFEEGSPYFGVEARVNISVPFETLFWFQKNQTGTEVENSMEALERFGNDFLLEWNVCDADGKQYEPTGYGVQQVADYSLITTLMAAWVEAIIQPNENLSKQSNGTDSSEKLSKELANLSEPLGS